MNILYLTVPDSETDTLMQSWVLIHPTAISRLTVSFPYNPKSTYFSNPDNEPITTDSGLYRGKSKQNGMAFRNHQLLKYFRSNLISR
jgi:hypothetical protein